MTKGARKRPQFTDTASLSSLLPIRLSAHLTAVESLTSPKWERGHYSKK
jgi:hypothetical protein